MIAQPVYGQSHLWLPAASLQLGLDFENWLGIGSSELEPRAGNRELGTGSF
jgi:hypothetical protein